MGSSQEILNFFKRAKENGKLSHGYLFFGGESGEMKNTALQLAEILGINAYDILYLAPPETKHEISIDQIRNLKKHLILSPYISQYKFAIIDRAELMSEDAANALLKTLEEPTRNTILIVITANPDLLAQTIVSRLEQIRFKSISLNQIADQIIEKEHIEILQKPINDVFKYIEKVSRDCRENKDDAEFFRILDSWALWFRKNMIEKQDFNLAEKIKNINNTQNMILSTNTNKRLALENLILEISNQTTNF
jgi:DNA polymerase III gamma/tau subunit